MKARFVKALIIASTVAAVVIAACSSTEPTPVCLIGRDYWVLKYTKVSGPAAGDCIDIAGPGEQIGMQKYGVVGQVQPLIAIRPTGINPVATQVIEGGLPDGGTGPVPTNPNADDPGGESNKPAAIGPLNADAPDNTGFCNVPTMADAVTTVVPCDPNAGCLSTVSSDAPIDYKFTNTKIWVTPNHPFGTQMKTTVQITAGTGATQCTATFNAIGLWPSQPIGRNDNSCADDADCKNAANLNIGQTFSSGISDDYDVFCDTSLVDIASPRTSGRRLSKGFCMLRCNDVPCLKSGIAP
jgi:hypothetical protein